MASNQLSKREQVDTQLQKIDKIVEETNLATLEQRGIKGITRAVTMARAMLELRRAISGPVLDALVSMAGNSLGFVTDRDKDPPEKRYGKEVLRDALIDGMLRGAQPVGNEINVISAKCYLTKNYFERMVLSLVDNLVIREGVPMASKDGRYALVPMRATWTFKGKPMELTCDAVDGGDTRIVVRVNSGMGVDAVLGKAFRKLYARIYRQCTGAGQWLEDEADDAQAITAATPSDPPKLENDDHTHASDVQPAAQSGEQAPEPPDPPEANDRWDVVRKTLAEMSTLSEVSEYFAEANKLCTHVDEFSKLADLCDARREEIRASRGERTNGKQDQETVVV